MDFHTIFLLVKYGIGQKFLTLLLYIWIFDLIYILLINDDGIGKKTLIFFTQADSRSPIEYQMSNVDHAYGMSCDSS